MIKLSGLCRKCGVREKCPIFKAFVELCRYDWVLVEGEIVVKICERTSQKGDMC